MNSVSRVFWIANQVHNYKKAFLSILVICKIDIYKSNRPKTLYYFDHPDLWDFIYLTVVEIRIFFCLVYLFRNSRYSYAASITLASAYLTKCKWHIQRYLSLSSSLSLFAELGFIVCILFLCWGTGWRGKSLHFALTSLGFLVTLSYSSCWKSYIRLHINQDTSMVSVPLAIVESQDHKRGLSYNIGQTHVRLWKMGSKP